MSWKNILKIRSLVDLKEMEDWLEDNYLVMVNTLLEGKSYPRIKLPTYDGEATEVVASNLNATYEDNKMTVEIDITSQKNPIAFVVTFKPPYQQKNTKMEFRWINRLEFSDKAWDNYENNEESWGESKTRGYPNFKESPSEMSRRFSKILENQFEVYYRNFIQHESGNEFTPPYTEWNEYTAEEERQKNAKLREYNQKYYPKKDNEKESSWKEILNDPKREPALTANKKIEARRKEVEKLMNEGGELGHKVWERMENYEGEPQQAEIDHPKFRKFMESHNHKVTSNYFYIETVVKDDKLYGISFDWNIYEGPTEMQHDKYKPLKNTSLEPKQYDDIARSPEMYENLKIMIEALRNAADWKWTRWLLLAQKIPNFDRKGGYFAE